MDWKPHRSRWQIPRTNPSQGDGETRPCGARQRDVTVWKSIKWCHEWHRLKCHEFSVKTRSLVFLVFCILGRIHLQAGSIWKFIAILQEHKVHVAHQIPADQKIINSENRHQAIGVSFARSHCAVVLPLYQAGALAGDVAIFFPRRNHRGKSSQPRKMISRSRWRWNLKCLLLQVHPLFSVLCPHGLHLQWYRLSLVKLEPVTVGMMGFPWYRMDNHNHVVCNLITSTYQS